MSVSELWLVLLSSRNFKELYDIASQLMDNDTLNSFIGDVIGMSKKAMFIEDWEKKMIDDLGEYHKEQIIRQEERALGLEQGIEIERTENIKKMLKANIDINTIIEVTNLKEEDILKIKDNMKEE